MNKLSKIALVSSLSILGSIITIKGLAIAQEPTSTSSIESSVSSQPGERRKQNIEQRELNLAERIKNRENKIQEKCENIGMKIIKHQEMFQARSQERLNKYNQISIRLEKIYTKLVEKNIEVTTYNSYLTELKTKINALNTLNQDYIQLFGSKANTGEFCNNKEQLSAEVDIRKAKLQAIIAKDKEIRIYIKETILPYLKTIKTGLSPESSTTSSNTQVQTQ